MRKQQPAELTRDEATQDRRVKIVEAATRCFIAKGFHQTGIRDIATAAGISLGNLYNHFESKDALIAEIARMDAEELQAVLAPLDKSLDPRQAIEHFIDSYLDYALRPENVVLTVEITAEAFRNPDVGKEFAVNRRAVTKAVSDVLAQGIQTGAFDPKLNTDEASELILDAVEGLAIRLTFSGRQTDKAPRQTLHVMVRKFLSVR